MRVKSKVMALCGYITACNMLAAVTGLAQRPGPTTEPVLGDATRRVAEPFSGVAGMHERSDGSLVVLDTKENEIHLIDRAGNRMRSLGRQGGGPGEYLLPISMIGLPGDTTLIADAGKRVFHVIPSDGSMRTTLPWPADGGLGLATIRGVDSKGRVYFVSDAWKVAERGAGNYAVSGDSIPLQRWDRVTGRVEAVCQLRITSPGDDAARRTAIRSNAVPFVGRDDASVAPDGRVTVARAHPFAIDVVAPDGSLRSGQPIAHTALRVTEDDRNAIRQSRRGSRFMSTNTQGAAPDLTADPPWDEFKPPFLYGRSVITAPDGVTWVHRTTPHNDTMPKYDRFSASGTLLGAIRLPPRSRVVAFARDGIWLAREDDDGLLWLSKHPPVR